MSSDRPEPGQSRGAMSRRGRGVGRGQTSDDGFDRFGKREFERHSGSDKTYDRLSCLFALHSQLWCILCRIFLHLCSSFLKRFVCCCRSAFDV